jgi:hypothetical protein
VAAAAAAVVTVMVNLLPHKAIQAVVDTVLRIVQDTEFKVAAETTVAVVVVVATQITSLEVVADLA